ncbi:hypothetical protein [Domibacillus robiginosus]|uniref:hypothetical protein n=1 Tax=Domibacillus robiginosus TaxID=1071054 RepID=UPI00067AACC0|nr:hypothetical protein [Domibacillus robiginosus]
MDINDYQGIDDALIRKITYEVRKQTILVARLYLRGRKIPRIVEETEMDESTVQAIVKLIDRIEEEESRYSGPFGKFQREHDKKVYSEAVEMFSIIYPRYEQGKTIPQIVEETNLDAPTVQKYVQFIEEREEEC